MEKTQGGRGKEIPEQQREKLIAAMRERLLAACTKRLDFNKN
jgi:hypothetical protein